MAITNASDKMVVGGVGLLMCIQNWSFFQMYYSYWVGAWAETAIPEACHSTSFWLGYDAFVCWFETVMAAGMVLGAWYEGSRSVFWFFFVVHLIGGTAGYTVATFGMGSAVFSEDFTTCHHIVVSEHGPSFNVASVWSLQAIFYVPYCVCMAAMFYWVALKMPASTGSATGDDNKLLVAGLGIIMAIQNYGFFQMYYGVLSDLHTSVEICHSLATWVSVSAFACFAETVMALGMMFGGWMDNSRALWWFFFVVHLIIALAGYTGGLIGVGAAAFSDVGESCVLDHVLVNGHNLTEHVPQNGLALAFFDNKIKAVFMLQAVFYPFYCVCMVALLYFVVIKMAKQGESLSGQAAE